MTDKEVRKLKKSDLLEILSYLRQENDELREENEKLKAQLETGMKLQDSEIDRIRQTVLNVVKDAMNNPKPKKQRSNRNEA